MASNRIIHADGSMELWSNASQAGDSPAGYTFTAADGASTQRPLNAAETAFLAGIDTDTAQAANKAAILAKADAAIQKNLDYLAFYNNNGTPTTAQAIAQVKFLTQTANALIRIARGNFTDAT